MFTKETITNDPSANIFLTGAVILANLDYSGLLDYALKAVIGGAIWLAFKIGAEYYTRRAKQQRAKITRITHHRNRRAK